MSIAFLESPNDFPEIEQADKSGIVAALGDLTPDYLLVAYSKGIFPWFNSNEPIVWWSPDPRMVLFPKEFKVSKSFRNILNRKQFEVTFNNDFEGVIRCCASVPRHGQHGTWLTTKMQQAYLKMHQLGWAHSVEVYLNGKLVGGLYGIGMNQIFFGESMFSLVSNTSKVALYALCQKCIVKGVKIIDCQIHNSHLESLGAREISRTYFKKYLPSELQPQKLDW